MQFSDWEPIYREILAEFGFSREEDEEAARLLQRLLLGRENDLSPEDLSSMIRRREVLVCGNGPSLPLELKEFLEELDTGEIAVIAADGATTTLLAAGTLPDLIVTDLDGFLPDILAASERGSAVVVHAHGDNMDALKEYVPRLRRVLGTTQAEPMEGVSNFGGFSDGDRCVFLARSFGAGKIRIIGFDYDDPDVTPVKKKKLKWARRLVAMALEDESAL
ncbi:6-hydroxymethylpterin diphosphokinase MptE-like protein [Methanocrinis sp.]|uniref:6-hydroxymethylpterin diphosphokinase MptE-like protein n=1 Tax=Methanocrinis sp. TaxID=3101522 RepID=UPI003D102E96